jgi:hypothetical protein
MPKVKAEEKKKAKVETPVAKNLKKEVKKKQIVNTKKPDPATERLRLNAAVDRSPLKMFLDAMKLIESSDTSKWTKSQKAKLAELKDSLKLMMPPRDHQQMGITTCARLVDGIIEFDPEVMKLIDVEASKNAQFNPVFKS